MNFKNMLISLRAYGYKRTLRPQMPSKILLKTNPVAMLFPGKREERAKILATEDRLYHNLLNAFSLLGAAGTSISENVFDESFIKICEAHFFWAFAVLDSHHRVDLIDGHHVQHFVSELKRKSINRDEVKSYTDFFNRFVFNEELPGLAGSNLKRAMSRRDKLALIQFASLWRIFKASNDLIKIALVHRVFPKPETTLLFEEMELLGELLSRKNPPELRFQLESERNRYMRDWTLEHSGTLKVSTQDLSRRLEEQRELDSGKAPESEQEKKMRPLGHDESLKLADAEKENGSAGDYVSAEGFDGYAISLAFMAAPFLAENLEISCPDLWEAMREKYSGPQNSFVRNESEKVRRTIYFDGDVLCNVVNDRNKPSMQEESFLRNYNAKVRKIFSSVIVSNS
ncbi:hypothetical protein [Desulfovibrio sp. JC022]|uniref:hypothetical protein n=1 Tax=Desulfovibrio sp. JC022 TaxID=2593642 RepID=UPI0013D5EBC7|nr:hypothetical protein [Desulfovibrio sp. JC022]NDV24317.1 hypothetical protein [Desulfovibrio sp. JC022]